MAPKRKSLGGTTNAPNKKGKTSGESTSSDLNQFLLSTFQLASNLQDGLRNIAANFLKLPPKKLFPDYYTIIQEPISLHEIKSKITAKSYDSVTDFLADLDLLTENAATYNDPESSIVKDAETIHQFVKDQVDEYLANVKKTPKIKIKTLKKEALSPEPKPTTSSFNEALTTFTNAIIDHQFGKLGVLSDPFLDEPSREDYPEYYDLIKNPMAFNTILDNIESNSYTTLDEFKDDFELIFQNAQLYNADDSLIFQDSVRIEKVYKTKVAELQKKLEKEPPLKKLKLRLNPGKESPSPKIKLNLKPVEEPAQSKRRSRKGRNDAKKLDAVKQEEPELEPEQDEEPEEDMDQVVAKEDDEAEDNDKNDDEEQTNEDGEVIEGDDSNPEASEIKDEPIKGVSRKRDSDQTAADAFIQEFSLISSSSTYKYYTKQKQVSTEALTGSMLSNLFEYKFEANDYKLQSYSISLPPAPNSSAITILTSLIESLTRREYISNLLINNEKVSPVPSHQYVGENLHSKYEVKLAVGLNQIAFEVKVAPIAEEEARFTRNQLAISQSNWDTERYIFWVNVIQA